MDWIGTVIGSLISGGLGVTIGTIYTAKKNAQVGMSGNEVEAAKAKSADWASYTERIETRLGVLETKIEVLQNQNTKAEDYIDDLHRHIWMRLQPPPPPRPK